jgi:ligand-binding sensor domain-containing protein
MWVGSQGGLTVITPTQINRWRTTPLSLNCREHTHDGLAWQNWRNVPMTETVISDVNSNGLAADGDLLWGATDYGLIRLDTRTWKCDVFTEVAGIPLRYVDTLLPDGEGGLWVGTDQGLLRFSAGKWRMALPPVDGFSPTALGLHQNGGLHVEMGYGRSGAILDADTLSVIETHDYSERPWLLDFADCSRWQRLSTWHVARGEAYSHLTQVGYVTQAGCEQIARQITSVRLHSTFVAASAEGDETWTAETRPLQPTWLTRRRGEAVEVVGIPHQTVLALTLSRDIWLATRDEFVRGVRVVDKGTVFVFQPLALNAEVFPGSARSLAVDKAGGVWAVNGDSVLRYDELDHAWRRVISATHSADVIAADPLRGVWVAGRGELMRVTQEQRQIWPLPDVITGTPTALLIDKSGRLWLGTLQDGVWTAAPSAASTGNELFALDWYQFTNRDGLADTRITTLARSPDGHIYAGHHAGVSVFGPIVRTENGRWTALPDSSATDGKGWVNALAWNEGRLWVGYSNDAALRSYENRRWTDHALSSVMHGVGTLLVSSDGTLWVGTTEGLWCWPDAGNGEPRWQRFSPGSLVVQDVLALAQAPGDGDKNVGGRVWVGGREGVAMSREPVGE